MPWAGVSLVWQFSLSIGPIEHKDDPKPQQQAKDVGCPDWRENSLSPRTLELQRRIRHQLREAKHQLDFDYVEHGLTEEERLADEESLHLLEVATSTNSKLAKLKDRESLAILMHWTSVKDRIVQRSEIQTPQQDFFWPECKRFNKIDDSPLEDAAPFSTPSSLGVVVANHEHLKGLNGTPRSYAPSPGPFSSVEGEERFKESRNEFEEILRRSVVQKGELVPGNATNEYICTQAGSVMLMESQDVRLGGMSSNYITMQVSSVVELMGLVKQRDGKGKGKGNDETNSRSWPSSREVSPTMFIKHRPKASGMLKDADNEVPSPSAVQSTSSEGDGKEVEVLTPSSGQRSDDAEEWEIVQYETDSS